MNITVNGEMLSLADGVLLGEFLAQRGYCAPRVIIEHNGELPPPQMWDHRTLREGDRLEILQFVGGG